MLKLSGASFLYKRCSSQSQGVHPHDLIPSQSHHLTFQHMNFTGTQTCRPQQGSPPDSLLEHLNQAVCLQCFGNIRAAQLRWEGRLLPLEQHTFSGAFIPSACLFLFNLNFVLSSSPASTSIETSSLIPQQVLGHKTHAL